MQVCDKDLIKRIFLRTYGERKRGFEDNKVSYRDRVSLQYRNALEFLTLVRYGSAIIVLSSGE